MLEGLIIDGWKVCGLLGRGGSAEIYRVDNVNTGEIGALKIARDNDEHRRMRFEREKIVLSAGLGLRFPRLLGSGVWDGRCYLVMELLHAHDELPNNDKDVAKYALAICEALTALHAFGYVHRDIKPGNVMFRYNANGKDELVVVDFGLAKLASQKIKTVLVDGPSLVNGKIVGVGTPGYAAPEQFTGEDASPLMDIHALGALIAKCFANKVPSSWKGLVNRATSSLPKQRFQSIDEVINAIYLRHRIRRWIARSSIVVLMGGIVLMSIWSFISAKQIKDAFIEDSLEGNTLSLPGFPPKEALARPNEDAILKIESMLRRAERQYKLCLEGGITNQGICLPDLDNCQMHYQLTPEIRAKYEPIIKTLYDRIENDAKLGKCGHPTFYNVCRTLY